MQPCQWCQGDVKLLVVAMMPMHVHTFNDANLVEIVS